MRVLVAEELLERAWDEAADPFTTAVKQTMRRLRLAPTMRARMWPASRWSGSWPLPPSDLAG
jgi:hypothetical protein